jgi:hypothetical protein
MFAEHKRCAGEQAGWRFQHVSNAVAPIGTSQKFELIQCAACGVPVAAIATSQMEALRSQIASIDDRLTRIAKSLAE